MVMRPLVEWEVKEAAALIRALDKTVLKVSTAFWMYDPYVADWQLHLTSAALLTEDLAQMYELVAHTIQATNEIHYLTLHRIKLVDPTTTEIQKVTRELPPEFKQELPEPLWYSSSSTTSQSPSSWLIYKST